MLDLKGITSDIEVWKAEENKVVLRVGKTLMTFESFGSTIMEDWKKRGTVNGSSPFVSPTEEYEAKVIAHRYFGQTYYGKTMTLKDKKERRIKKRRKR